MTLSKKKYCCRCSFSIDLNRLYRLVRLDAGHSIHYVCVTRRALTDDNGLV